MVAAHGRRTAGACCRCDDDGALLAYCLTEPGSGSDAASLRTRASATATTTCSTAARPSSPAAALRRLRRHAAHRRRRPEGHLGVGGRTARPASPSARRRRRSAGTRSRPRGDLRGRRVPVGNRSARRARAFVYAMRGLDGGRINIAAARWAARAALRRLAHLHRRAQAVRPALADSRRCSSGWPTWPPTSRRRAYGLPGRSKLDAGAPDETAACAMAKRFATDAASTWRTRPCSCMAATAT